MLKKIAVLTFICALILAFSTSCKPKAKTTPPPPPAQEQPKVEKVDDTTAVKKPALTEEEIFMSKSLEQINLEAPLKMIDFDYDHVFDPRRRQTDARGQLGLAEEVFERQDPHRGPL